MAVIGSEIIVGLHAPIIVFVRGNIITPSIVANSRPAIPTTIVLPIIATSVITVGIPVAIAIAVLRPRDCITCHSAYNGACDGSPRIVRRYAANGSAACGAADGAGGVVASAAIIPKHTGMSVSTSVDS